MSANIASSTSAQPTTRSNFSGFQVPHILSWKNPYETGVLLAEALCIFIVFSSTFSLRVFLKIASTIIGLFSVVEWGSRAISGQRQGLILNYKPSRFLPLSDKLVQDVTTYVTYGFRRVSYNVEQLVDARNPFKGIQLAGALYVAYILLGLFTLKKLVLITIVLAFGVPPLYLQFKPQVDKAISELLEKACREVKILSDKAHQKAGPQIEQVKKIFGSRGGFPGTANYNPVKEVPTAAAAPTAYTSSVKSTSTSTVPSGVTTEASTQPAATTTTTTTTSTTTVPDVDAFKNFSSVPTLAGNVPIDHEKLDAALAADKAKHEGAVNF